VAGGPKRRHAGEVDNALADVLGQDLTKFAAEEKQRLLSRLLARLAHEIRNPLSSLAIHVQLLEEDMAQSSPALLAKAAGRFEIIRSELQRLENLMRQFLSLAAPSSVHLQTIEAAEVVGYVCELLRPEAAARGIELVMSVPEGLPPVSADPAQLKQALINLVINSIQAIERNGRIEVDVRADPAAGAFFLRVSDNGPGVSGEKRSAIFEPFFTTKPDGSGLGLWIVQQIATAHGGLVAVEDRPGGGAAFVLRLPFAAGRGEDAAPHDGGADAGRAREPNIGGDGAPPSKKIVASHDEMNRQQNG
jgi:signal transduction histidine kinase